MSIHAFMVDDHKIIVNFDFSQNKIKFVNIICHFDEKDEVYTLSEYRCHHNSKISDEIYEIILNLTSDNVIFKLRRKDVESIFKNLNSKVRDMCVWIHSFDRNHVPSWKTRCIFDSKYSSAIFKLYSALYPTNRLKISNTQPSHESAQIIVVDELQELLDLSSGTSKSFLLEFIKWLHDKQKCE